MCRSVYALVVCFAISSFAWAQTPAVPVASSSSLKPTASLSDLLADARLRGKVPVNATWARLDVLLAALAEESKVSIRATPDTAGRRINLFTLPPQASAAQDMAVIARLTGFQWERIDTEGKIGYQLFRSDAQRKRDDKEVRNSELREDAARRAGEAAVSQAINQEIAHCKDTGETGFGSYLAAFSPTDLAQAAQVAQDHVQVISAGDQRHLFPFFVAGRSFGDLPPATQQAIRKMTSRDEYAAGNPGGRYAPAANSDDALTHCQFGLVANGGQIQLALFNPEADDIWVSPFEKLEPKANNSLDLENDLDPDVVRQMENPKLVSGLPPLLAARKIKIPAKVDRKRFSTLMEYFAKTHGIASASESWIRTATTSSFISGLLPPEDTVTVGDALKQIARTFGQRMVYENGVLYVTTLTRGRDLRAEIPADLWLRLADKNKTKDGQEQKAPAPLSLDDFADLGNLSPLQLDTLFDRSPNDLRFMAGMFLWTRNAYPVMHLYGLLSHEQRRQAESTDGLLLGNLLGEAGRWHRSTSSRGLTWVNKDDLPLTMNGLKPQHFYVKRDSDLWQFLLTRSQGAPLRQQIHMPDVVPDALKQ